MDATNIVGFVATILGTSMMLPQVIRLIRTKRSADLSFLMALAYLIACALWFTYGVRLCAPPIEWANGIGFIIGAIQLGLKVRYDRL